MYQADERNGAPGTGGLVAVAIVLLVAVIATRALWWGNPAATTDEQLYALIGGALAQGELPYVELWDRKPFGLFAVFAVGEWIAPAPYGFQILAGLFTAAGAAITYRIARSQVDWITATGAALLYAILISVYGGFSGQSEVFHAPMMLAMAWLVLDSSAAHYSTRTLAAMLIGGLALQMKYTVLPQCLFFGFVALWQLHKHGFGLPRLAAMAAAFAALGLLPTALVGVLYAGAGHFDVWWFANFESFFERGSAGRFLPNVQIGLLPLAGIGLAGVYLAFRGKPLRDPALYTLMLGWTLAALASVFLPGTVYLYYFGALVAPVILIALPLLDRKGPAKAVPLVLALAGTTWLLGPLADWKTSRDETVSLQSLAAKIEPLVDGPQCLWVHDGPTALYSMTDSCLPTRFIYPDHLNNALENDAALGASQSGEALIILADRPPVIVTSKRALTQQNAQVREALSELLETDYDELGRAESGYREVIAYNRSELSAR
ncbi:hypothetical protein ACRAQ6_12785 [Erythrobacter sp. HA6-11]